MGIREKKVAKPYGLEVSKYMANELILTIIAPDRPGLVGLLSDLVADHGGNWLESRMAQLAGSFAGILRVQIDEAKRPSLVAALEALDDVSLQIVAEPGGLAGSSETAASEACTLEVMGQDRPGIVRQISTALAGREVNVVELHTGIISAPMSGEPLFQATAKLCLPATCDSAELLATLEAIGEDLMVDVRMD